MTDRFDEMAREIAQKITTSGDDYVNGSRAIANEALAALQEDKRHG